MGHKFDTDKLISYNDAELDKAAREYIEGLNEFPVAYVSCVNVFNATDPEFLDVWVKGLFGSISDHAKRDDHDLVLKRMMEIIKRYFDEAHAIRQGLRSVQGEGRTARIRAFAEGLRETPPSAGALAVLAFCPTEADIQAIASAFAKKGAGGKHDKHTEPKKAEVRDWWLKWQSEPDMFKNKAAFDEAMFDKTGMKIRTIQEWRKALQSAHTVN